MSASLSRRSFLASALAAERRPNIVFILADDLGYADLSCFGSKAVRTPNLDQLAARGAKLPNFYAASAVCTPSRAAVLTGKYPLRFDIRKHFNDDENHLPVTAGSLPQLLKRAGYSTAHVGKWHLGGLHLKHAANRAQSIPGPHQHGFDHYVCQNEEQPLRTQMGRDRTLFRRGGTCLLRDDKPVTPEDANYSKHWTDIVGDEAARFVQTLRPPFFLNVWFLDPHMPYEPAPEPHWSAAEAPGISDDQRRFRSMVSHMDAKIGGITKALEARGLLSNTIVIFTSDNGGAYEADIGPYKGGKTDLHEGGLRVPAIFHWPDRIRPGQTLATFGQHVDILPTLCEAANVRVPRVDGVSLLAHLAEGKPAPKRGPVFWQLDIFKNLQRHYKKPEPWATEVVRDGRWKLLGMDGRPVALFDLEADPLESNSVLEREPAVAGRLSGALREFLQAPRDRSGAR